MSELAPCPFCGGKPRWNVGQNGDGSPWRYLACENCEAMGPHVPEWQLSKVDPNPEANDGILITAWNRRAPSPSPAPGAVEALRKARQLVDIATDWNLDEVEIDGEMVRTYSLGAEFDAALASLSQPAKGAEGGE